MHKRQIRYFLKNINTQASTQLWYAIINLFFFFLMKCHEFSGCNYLALKIIQTLIKHELNVQRTSAHSDALKKFQMSS